MLGKQSEPSSSLRSPNFFSHFFSPRSLLPGYIVTNISCIKGCHKVCTTKLLNSCFFFFMFRLMKIPPEKHGKWHFGGPKIKIFWGSMPPDPTRALHLRRSFSLCFLCVPRRKKHATPLKISAFVFYHPRLVKSTDHAAVMLDVWNTAAKRLRMR